MRCVVANCVHCGNELTNRKRKFCNESCRYWFNSIKKDSISSWGSKNSQVRLNKASARFAKRMRTGKTSVRYI